MTKEKAIEIFRNLIDEGFPYDGGYAVEELSDDDKEACNMAISALEQMPKTTTNNDRIEHINYPTDAVSIRKDALKTRVGNIVAYNVEWLKEHWQMEMDIVCGIKPCDDAISRADAQTEIMMSKSIVAFDRDLWIKTKDAVQILRVLPPVEPSSRKGHWIIKNRYYHDTVTAECSECGREVEIPTCMSELMYNGCPYCLADMRGAE